MLDGKRWYTRELRARHWRNMLTEIALIFLLGVGLLLFIAALTWALAALIINA